MIVDPFGGVKDSLVGPPEAVVVVTLVDDWRVYGRSLDQDEDGVRVVCADREVRIPVERIKFAEIMLAPLPEGF